MDGRTGRGLPNTSGGSPSVMASNRGFCAPNPSRVPVHPDLFWEVWSNNNSFMSINKVLCSGYECLSHLTLKEALGPAADIISPGSGIRQGHLPKVTELPRGQVGLYHHYIGLQNSCSALCAKLFLSKEKEAEVMTCKTLGKDRMGIGSLVNKTLQHVVLIKTLGGNTFKRYSSNSPSQL